MFIPVSAQATEPAPAPAPAPARPLCPIWSLCRCSMPTQSWASHTRITYAISSYSTVPISYTVTSKQTLSLLRTPETGVLCSTKLFTVPATPAGCCRIDQAPPNYARIDWCNSLSTGDASYCNSLVKVTPNIAVERDFRVCGVIGGNIFSPNRGLVLRKSRHRDI